MGATWRRLNSSAAWAAAAAVIVLLIESFRQYAFVNRYAVNMMYWDQWDFYEPILKRYGLWATFDYQYGAVRLGVGGLFHKLMAALSGCNTRWDEFAVSFVVTAAAAAAMILAWRIGYRRFLPLAAVPIPFFNFHQYESFVGASNVTPQAMPLLLIVLVGLAWTLRTALLRSVAIAVLTWLLMFTGYGIIGGMLVPPILAVELVHARRLSGWSAVAWNLAGLAASAAAWVMFFHGYQWNPGVGNFQFPYPRPGDYVIFFSTMLANPHGLGVHSWPCVVAGAAVGGLLFWICVCHGIKCLRSGPSAVPGSAAIFFMAAHSLAYCAFTAIGRVSLGLDAAPVASRYVTMMAPASVAILLHFFSSRSRGSLAAGTVYALLLIPVTTLLRTNEIASIDLYSNGKTAWRAAYLEVHDETKANKISHFAVHPTSVADELPILEAHHWNLFLPSKHPR